MRAQQNQPRFWLFLSFIIGAVPLMCLLLWSNPWSAEPLSVPITVKKGAYTSPPFRTAPGNDYQVEMYFLPGSRAPLDLDWKLIRTDGAVIASGVYKESSTHGNDAILGHYRPTGLSKQRIVLNIRQNDDDPGFDTTLHIGLPERSLDAGFAFPLVMAWGILFAGGGLIGLIVQQVRSHR
jgi:hypothetical protein